MDSSLTKKLPGYPVVNMVDDGFSWNGFTKVLLHLPSERWAPEDPEMKVCHQSFDARFLTHGKFFNGFELHVNRGIF